MTLIAQLKKLKDPERTAIVYDLYRIFMNAQDGYLRLEYGDGVQGASKEKLDKILASLDFENSWDKPLFAKELLKSLSEFTDWERSQKKNIDKVAIQAVLDKLFGAVPTPAYREYFNGNNLVFAEPPANYGSKK
jgi:hypothetical protein